MTSAAVGEVKSLERERGIGGPRGTHDLAPGGPAFECSFPTDFCVLLGISEPRYLHMKMRTITYRMYPESKIRVQREVKDHVA